MPRKTLKERQEAKKSTEQDLYPTDTDDTRNRVRSVIDNLTGKENPDDIMLELLEVLQESGSTPLSGKFYIFVYNPKTPNIRYDQNPLVGVTDVFPWGFRGINFHWRKYRQYTWPEVAGKLHVVRYEELDEMLTIPYAKFLTK